jgi:hypothetical protein
MNLIVLPLVSNLVFDASLLSFPVVVNRSVNEGGFRKGRELETTIRKSGIESVHRESYVCVQCLPIHYSKQEFFEKRKEVSESYGYRIFVYHSRVRKRLAFLVIPIVNYSLFNSED